MQGEPALHISWLIFRFGTSSRPFFLRLSANGWTRNVWPWLRVGVRQKFACLPSLFEFLRFAAGLSRKALFRVLLFPALYSTLSNAPISPYIWYVQARIHIFCSRTRVDSPSSASFPLVSVCYASFHPMLLCEVSPCATSSSFATDRSGSDGARHLQRGRGKGERYNPV